MTLLFLGPDHWLLRADLETEDALTTALRPDGAPPEISIVRVSDTLAFFRITGPGAPDILAIGCPLDLHERSFGQVAATFTEVFGLKALVTRCEGGFDVAVDRSLAAMVADCLARAEA
jgi:sarcosine oxidase subunit gamma